jgi:hypothetical protein
MKECEGTFYSLGKRNVEILEVGYHVVKGGSFLLVA